MTARMLYEGSKDAHPVSLKVQYAEDRNLDLTVHEAIVVAPTEEQDLVLTVCDGMGLGRMTLAILRSALYQHGPEFTAELMAYILEGLAEELEAMTDGPQAFDA